MWEIGFPYPTCPIFMMNIIYKSINFILQKSYMEDQNQIYFKIFLQLDLFYKF